MGYNMYGMELIILYFFEISLGILLAFVLLAVTFSFYSNKKRKKIIEETLTRIAEKHGFSLSATKEKPYEYELESGQRKLLIKVVFVPVNSSLTINSRNTWCLRYGGSAYHGGYTNMKYLKRLMPFLEGNFPDGSKIILVYPDTNKIQRYLNESEIAIVHFGEKVYDYKVATFAELERRFPDLL